MILASTLAQALAAAAPEAAAAPQSQGVIAYPREFFAAARPVNAFEMIERLPGFTFDGGDDDVRGFEGAAGNVLIDGQRPASKSDTLEEVLRRLPASKVARVELIRGGAPGIDMQGKSVLANVVRSDGGGFRGLVSVANAYVLDDGRAAPGVRLEGSGQRGAQAWELGLRIGKGIDDGSGDGPRTRLDGAGRPLALGFVESEGAGVQKTLTGAYDLPLWGGKLRLNGRAFWDDFDYDEVSRQTRPGASAEFDAFFDDKTERELGGRFTRSFGPRTTLEVVAIQQWKTQDFSETFRAPGVEAAFRLDNETGETIVRSVVKHRRSERLSVEGGAEAAFNWLEGETRYSENGAPIALPAADVRVEERRAEVFAKAVWRPTSRWTVEAGLRQEGSRISSEGDVGLVKTLYFTKPRFAVTWAPDDKTQIRFRYERAVGQLDFDDFVASSSFSTGVITTGNPDLDPEQAWVTEAAVERRFWGSGALVVTVRRSELKDVIDRAPVFSPEGVFDARANIGDGVKTEVVAGFTLPFDRLGMKGALLRGEATWRDSEVSDPTTGRTREITALRPMEWEAHFTQDLPQWRMTLGVDAWGAWRESYYRFNEVEVRKLKTFVTPFVEWKPAPAWSVRAELANVTERGFRNTRYRYSGPRGAAALAYVDDRDIQFGRMFYLRVRKTFGA